ncbi:MAG TPA: MFS transporter [Tepidisphaeraceae bacterium]|jgi:ACS family hexuronate transporter-like MFS transporter|nr:MFS transporter [Tepidisphaeraceae bacterium]
MALDPQPAVIDYAAPTRPRGYYRWVICALIFFATTVNYVDRQIIGVLAPTLKRELKWSDAQYGDIVFYFQLAYAIGLLLSGPVIDRIGTKLGYALSLLIWSIAAMAHALVRTVTGFSAARFALGLGEAGNFPAAIKTVAEWFPKRERALATGIFNAGTNVGAIVAPLLVPWITLKWGWEWAFLITGAAGLLWLALWLPMYEHPRRHPRVSSEELAWIERDPPEPTTRLRWREVVKYRQAWAFALGKFMTDPIWWFYLYWTGLFLDSRFGIKLSQLSLPLVVIYLVADIGSVGGGWISSRLIKQGWSINLSRKSAMLVCALCVLPVTFAPLTNSLWTAVALISIATAAHQGWSANLFTVASDLFPKRAVGSVVGLGGMLGSVGGMLAAKTIGQTLERTKNYLPIFIVAGTGYLLALLVVHLLAPRMEPARVDS